MKHRIIVFVILVCFFPLLHSQEPYRAGQIEFMLSIPYVNSFYSKPEEKGAKFGIGFWGISGGLGYQYSSNKYINLLYSGQLQYELPVPMGIDYEGGVVESHNSSNISLMNNYQVEKWTLGAGLSHSWFTWRINYYEKDPDAYLGSSAVISNQSLGLNFSAHYKLLKHFYIGLIYRPDLLMISPQLKFNYQHSISLDFSWRWRINTAKAR